MPRPSPALVVAVIALVFAMGGTGYAVAQLPKNSVGTKQLRKSAVTSAKIKDGTIATADLSAAARDALKGETGAAGAAGAAGASGGSGGAQAATNAIAGASAVGYSGQALPTGGAVLANLGAAASGTSSGPVAVTAASRLQAVASVELSKAGANWDAEGQVTCRIVYRAVGAAEWRNTLYTSTAQVTLPASKLANETVYGTAAVVGMVKVAAGSYDMAVFCTPSPTRAPVRAFYSSLVVTAFPG